MVRVFRQLFDVATTMENSSSVISDEALDQDLGPLTKFGENEIICHHVHEIAPFGVFYGQNPLEFSFPLILLQVSFVILLTRVVRQFLKPLKQPRVVSEILGGMLVGPSALGHSKRFANWMFPGHSDFIFQNLGLIGIMYFLFFSGVKMDILTIKRSTKKQWYIALFGMFIPFVATMVVGVSVSNSLDHEMKKGSSIWGVSAALAISAFPSLHPIIQELNLLSSDVGRMALAAAVIGDVVGINGVVVFEAAKQGEGRNLAPLGYLMSLLVMMITIIGGSRLVMTWIIKTTPEGKPVEQVYIVAILLGVLVMGFLTDMFGLCLVNGPLWLGLAVPDGAPLRATLVQKCESFALDILMPFAFTYVGLITDVYSMHDEWTSLEPLFLLALTAYLTKFVSTFLVTRFFRMPLRDGITLSLIMSLRGQIELVLFLHWMMDFKMIGIPQFTMLVLLTMVITGIATLLINVVYDPNRPYMVNKRRTIQHTAPNTELHMVVCFHDQESVPGIFRLLEVFNPTVQSPFSIYALHLIELVGRAAPVFTDHSEEDGDQNDTSTHNNTRTIRNALQTIQRAKSDIMKIHRFTSVAPKKSMYQDVCELALDKKTSFIVLPFERGSLSSLAGTNMVQNSVKSLNSTILEHAPCSVAVYLDRGGFRAAVGNVGLSMTRISYRFAMLFLGGADAREALACADRMAANPDVSLTVIRFLAHNGEGDDEMEKKLDDGLVTWFWVKNEGNHKVSYKEVVVKHGSETVAAIQTMSRNYYDLWIVGRKQGINPTLVQGLSNWSENRELGVIGDYLASVDLSSSASVLVVQQQVLRDEETDSGGLQGRIRRYFSKCEF